MKTFASTLLWILLLLVSSHPQAEVTELRVPKGAGGIAFLPLLVMEKQHLIESQAAKLGYMTLKVSYVNLGGASVAIDALLSGATHLHAAGPPSFLILWDRTRTSMGVTGIAAMTSLPGYLNTTNPRIRSLRDVTDKDRIALNGVKVSIPAIIMQMEARREFGSKETFRYDPYTVSMSHPEGLAALLSGISEINLHFTSVSFHAREIKDPRVRTILSSDDVMGGPTTFTMLSTTRKFRDENPLTYKAILLGLKEAVAYINNNKRGAAQIYFDSIGGKGETLEEIIASLDDPKNVMTITPQNTFKYASFMNEIGSLKNRPTSWKDLFFSDIHELDGN